MTTVQMNIFLMRLINFGADLVSMVSKIDISFFFSFSFVSSIQICEKVLCFAFVSLLPD